MAKKKIVTSNIQDNHTLAEYQRYFSHLLEKGKLKRFSLNEKDRLDPKRQYWKITDEQGKTYYYELPKYIKPGSDKTAYSMSRVMHRRPARVAIAIFAGAILVSVTSMVIGKSLQKGIPDIPPQPLPDPEGLFKAMKEFNDWKEANPDADATEKFNLADLATVGMANTLYDDQQYDSETATYPRRKLLTVGQGNTLTNAVFDVHVDISNAFIFKDGRALEESISYCNLSIPFIHIPQVGRRDFYTATSEEDGYIKSNPGTATGIAKATWVDNDDREFNNKEEYEAAAGKTPDSPFLYSINEETILSGSSVSKKEDGSGYDIDINLDTTKGITRYAKRMTYLSDKVPTFFYYVNLHFTTDNNLHFLSSSVNEKYDVDQVLVTVGELKTKFYYDNIPDIPDRVTPFEYSKYPIE